MFASLGLNNFTVTLVLMIIFLSTVFIVLIGYPLVSGIINLFTPKVIVAKKFTNGEYYWKIKVAYKTKKHS